MCVEIFIVKKLEITKEIILCMTRRGAVFFVRKQVGFFFFLSVPIFIFLSSNLLWNVMHKGPLSVVYKL